MCLSYLYDKHTLISCLGIAIAGCKAVICCSISLDSTPADLIRPLPHHQHITCTHKHLGASCQSSGEQLGARSECALLRLCAWPPMACTPRLTDH
jgi:hypothetical protein